MLKRKEWKEGVLEYGDKKDYKGSKDKFHNLFLFIFL